MKGIQEQVKVFKAFSDEKRLMILEKLKGGELCACDLLEDMEIGQSTLSHHMKILTDAGIVNGRKEGKWTHYSISKSGSLYAQQLLSEITNMSKIKNKNCD